ncbi:HIG1 domain family member 2A [Habropoda laboriosa]|uniref:HIG1 domain family member 2A n=1 Tax=Habropoda laboriosa TaxID=597456 RepID=A0A0L7QKH1_9HYME|nr:PREDICTED: HIG1 domain family member 2A, mitochondrial [Habropoda laboriosa]KOC59122.1 HIG1 domain family member 2A [Habropoda laboriosa]
MSKDTSTNSVKVSNELDWLSLYGTNGGIKTETFGERLIRKCKENPLVPIGTTATTAALTYGLWSFYCGNALLSQYMMRARVGAQAFTILSIVGGCIIAGNKDNA